jgi:hypothetical protein
MGSLFAAYDIINIEEGKKIMQRKNNLKLESCSSFMQEESGHGGMAHPLDFASIINETFDSF